jgi:hypothetical protein
VWDALKGVHLSWEADNVSNNVANDSQHGSTSVTQLGLTEKWDKRRVGFREAQLYRRAGKLYSIRIPKDRNRAHLQDQT